MSTQPKEPKNLRVTIAFTEPVNDADKGDMAGELIDAVEEALDEFPGSTVKSITVEDDTGS